MSVRYIGSKARLSDVIIDILGAPSGKGYFIDGFCGTGAVGRAAARRGWPVRINDHLYSSVITAGACLLAVDDVPFDGLGGYNNALDALAASPSETGFITREYSPVSLLYAPVERRYFTEANAALIDGARRQIATWAADRTITVAEERLLLADLLAAVNRVANIAGTYGCFLREWSPQSLRQLELVPRPLLPEPVPVDATVGDVSEVPIAPDDVSYYDPPYTKRQYAAYYHVLETIAYGDEPAVDGVTGLRPWRHLASDFCYRSRALTAITELVANSAASRVLLSYSSEGHVDRVRLEDALNEQGELTVHAIEGVGRYRPNRAASAAGSDVTEFIFDLNRDPVEVAA